MSHYLFSFLIRYKYAVIFPVAIIEGPILTLVCGFLVSLGILSLAPTVLVVFAGDIISDSVYFNLGKHGRRFLERIKFLRISESKLQKLEEHFEKHPGKTLIVSKATYGVGSLFLAAAGASKMSYQKFLEYITPLNLARSSALLAIGYFLGKAVRNSSTYVEYYTIGVIIILPTTYYIYRKFQQIQKNKIHDKKHVERL